MPVPRELYGAVADCTNWNCPRCRDPRKEELVSIIKDRFETLSGQIETLTTTIQTANVSKRKRSDSTGAAFVHDDQALASRNVPGNVPSKVAKYSPPEAKGDDHRRLSKHCLSPQPEPWSDIQSIHFCELDRPFCSMHLSRCRSLP